MTGLLAGLWTEVDKIVLAGAAIVVYCVLVLARIAGEAHGGGQY